MRIICVGEAMIEFAPTGSLGTYARSFAGDTFNTAWYLKALRPDWSVEYLTAVGTDSLSDEFLSFATEAGIGTDFIQRHPYRKMAAYMIQLKEAERSFHYWRETSAARTLADDRTALDAAFAGADLVFVSGITSAIIGPDGRRILNDALGRARGAGVKTAFDPNLRPALWPDPATMTRETTQAARFADYVFPSFDEEAHHFGDLTPRMTMERYRAAGASCVVVKNGDGGVFWRIGAEEGHFTPPAIDHVRDTTAAGDSFNAGFLAGSLAGLNAEASLTIASHIAGQVIQKTGALVSIDRTLA